jgi:predicted MPP superfamily phosphohydrolase
MVHIPFPEEGDPLSFIAFSDLHEQAELTAELSANLDWEGVDYAFYIGDLLNNTAVPEQVIDSILNLPTGDHNLPRVFVRGNHETRGPAARQLSDWLLPPGGEWYFTFFSSEVFFIILDSGEDKADEHPEYAGLVDFTAYHQQQAEWLAGVFNSQEYQQAAIRIVLVHHPPFANVTEAFSPVAELLETQTEIDLVISGHIHEAGVWLSDDTGLPFPVATCGGSSRDDMAAVRVDIGSDGLQLRIINLEGALLEEATLPLD